LPTLQDVIINEGLRGWNVRFYLAVVKKHPISGYTLDVVFEVSILIVLSRAAFSELL